MVLQLVGVSQAITLQYLLLPRDNNINLKIDAVSSQAACEWSKQHSVSSSSAALIDRVSKSFTGKHYLFLPKLF